MTVEASTARDVLLDPTHLRNARRGAFVGLSARLLGAAQTIKSNGDNGVDFWLTWEDAYLLGELVNDWLEATK